MPARLPRASDAPGRRRESGRSPRTVKKHLAPALHSAQPGSGVGLLTTQDEPSVRCGAVIGTLAGCSLTASRHRLQGILQTPSFWDIPENGLRTRDAALCEPRESILLLLTLLGRAVSGSPGFTHVLRLGPVFVRFRKINTQNYTYTGRVDI